ncbi:MAG: hypothetical protein WCZ10_14130 [Desulfobulbaceae bacterium]
MSEEIKEMLKARLEEIKQLAAGGSKALIQYTQDRLEFVTQAAAAGATDLPEILEHETQNILTYAATEAVVAGDKVDAFTVELALSSIRIAGTLLIERAARI